MDPHEASIAERIPFSNVATPPSSAALLVIQPLTYKAMVLKRLLAELPWDPVQSQLVHNLEDALSLLPNTPFDGIVTALPLPDTLGFDAVVRLQAAAPKLPITLLTELQDEQFALQALALGAQEYLVEGTYSPSQLLHSIRRAHERKALERRLVELSHYDDVTGLRNRALLRDRFAHLLLRARREGQGFAFVIIEFLGIMEVEQDKGEAHARKLIHQLASLLAESMRSSDTLARLTYNQLGLLLEHIPPAMLPDTVARLTSPLRQALASGPTMASSGIQISTGSACFPEDGQTVERLIISANDALHRHATAISAPFRIRPSGS